MSTSLANEWQLNKSLQESNAYLFENEVETDVTFKIGNDKIRAHKLILSARSPVFFAMFYGQLKETKNEIEILDAEAQAFRDFIRYLYTDKISTTVTQCMGVSYLSEKYIIPRMQSKVQKCILQQIPDMCIVDLLHLFNQAISQQSVQIINGCMDYIHAGSIKDNKTCLNLLSHTALKYLVETWTVKYKEESKSVLEQDIFELCLHWAKETCQKESLTPDGVNLRKCLGNIIYSISFPVFELHYFAKHVSTLGILTDEECVAIFQYITLRDEHSKLELKHCPFPTYRAGSGYVKIKLLSFQKLLRTYEFFLDDDIACLYTAAKKLCPDTTTINRLKYKNKILQQGVTIRDYNIVDGDSITII